MVEYGVRCEDGIDGIFYFSNRCVRMVDLLEMRFDLRKSCVMRLDVWYIHFDLWKGMRMVDILTSGKAVRGW